MSNTRAANEDEKQLWNSLRMLAMEWDQESRNEIRSEKSILDAITSTPCTPGEIAANKNRIENALEVLAANNISLEKVKAAQVLLKKITASPAVSQSVAPPPTPTADSHYVEAEALDNFTLLQESLKRITAPTTGDTSNKLRQKNILGLLAKKLNSPEKITGYEDTIEEQLSNLQKIASSDNEKRQIAEAITYLKKIVADEYFKKAENITKNENDLRRRDLSSAGSYYEIAKKYGHLGIDNKANELVSQANKLREKMITYPENDTQKNRRLITELYTIAMNLNKRSVEEASVRIFENAQKIETDATNAANLGYLTKASELMQKAIREYEMANEISFNDKPEKSLLSAQIALGSYQLSSNNIKEAIASLDKAYQSAKETGNATDSLKIASKIQTDLLTKGLELLKNEATQDAGIACISKSLEYAKLSKQSANIPETEKANISELFYNFGTKLVREKKHEEAATYFSQAIELGHLKANASLGLLYLEGKGVERNQEHGIALLTKAADQNHARAQYHLAKYYHSNVERIPEGIVKTTNYLEKLTKNPGRISYDDAEDKRLKTYATDLLTQYRQLPLITQHLDNLVPNISSKSFQMQKENNDGSDPNKNGSIMLFFTDRNARDIARVILSDVVTSDTFMERTTPRVEIIWTPDLEQKLAAIQPAVTNAATASPPPIPVEPDPRLIEPAPLEPPPTTTPTQYVGAEALDDVDGMVPPTQTDDHDYDAAPPLSPERGEMQIEWLDDEDEDEEESRPLMNTLVDHAFDRMARWNEVTDFFDAHLSRYVLNENLNAFDSVVQTSTPENISAIKDKLAEIVNRIPLQDEQRAEVRASLAQYGQLLEKFLIDQRAARIGAQSPAPMTATPVPTPSATTTEATTTPTPAPTEYENIHKEAVAKLKALRTEIADAIDADKSFFKKNWKKNEILKMVDKELRLLEILPYEQALKNKLPEIQDHFQKLVNRDSTETAENDSVVNSINEFNRTALELVENAKKQNEEQAAAYLVIATKNVPYDPSKSILQNYENYKDTSSPTNPGSHATLTTASTTNDIDTNKFNSQQMRLSTVELKDSNNERHKAVYAETFVNNVASSTLVDLPTHLSPASTWQSICDKLLTAPMREKYGIPEELTQDHFKNLFEEVQKNMRKNPDGSMQDHIAKALKEQGFTNAVQHPNDMTKFLTKQFDETYTVNNEQPNKMRGYTFPSNELLKLVSSQLNSIIALKPNEPIYMNNAPSVHYAKAVMLYAKAHNIEVVNNTPYKKIEPSSKEVDAFQVLLRQENIKHQIDLGGVINKDNKGMSYKAMQETAERVTKPPRPA